MRVAYQERNKAPEARKPSEVGEHYAELCNIEGIGMSVADDLVFFFGEEHNLKILDDLEKELTIEAVEAPATIDSPVAGQTVVFTGPLETLPRREDTGSPEPLGPKVARSDPSTPHSVEAGAVCA